MGIPGLPALIESETKKYAVKSYDFSRFYGMRVGIDISLMTHQTVIAIRSSGKDLKNKEGQLTSHLHGIFYKLLNFLQNGMTPIPVFDGKSPDMKSFILEKRKSRKDKALKNIESIEDTEDEEYIKNFKQTFTPKKKDYDELKIMLNLMGIPYIEAPGEADAVLAWLAAKQDVNTGKRYIKGVVSDDSDMLALGAPYLFKDMLKYMGKNKKIKVISLNKALKKMELTMNQFVDMCVLIGCDYCPHIMGMGRKTALKLIKSHGSLKKVIKYLEKTGKFVVKSDSESESDSTSDNEININDNKLKKTKECMLKAADYFKNAVKKLDQSDNFVLTDDNLTLKKFQKNELLDFMINKHGFNQEKISEAVDRLSKYYDKMNITRENNKKFYTVTGKKNIFTQIDANVLKTSYYSGSEIEDNDEDNNEDNAIDNSVKEGFSDEKIKTKKDKNIDFLFNDTTKTKGNWKYISKPYFIPKKEKNQNNNDN